ncbi:MAG: hypothetical protein U1B80_00690 [Anaerolineaceae bacterium]|nr:hypothetical protein [Anaerolineaceae bacterium]
MSASIYWQVEFTPLPLSETRLPARRRRLKDELGAEMNEDQAALLAEQMRRALDLMKAEVNALKAQQAHDRELVRHRLSALEGRSDDHELRLRTATDGVTQFKMWAGLASGGSGLMAFVALIRAFLGG